MKIGFIFSGYGSQSVGMGKELYDQSRVVQELFEEASSCLDMNFVKLCFASSDIELSKIENAYVALFVTSVAIARVLEQEGIVPTQVAGYDVGEYCAVATINALSTPDALYLLKKQASFYQQFLDECPAKGMRVKGMSYDDLEALCKKVSKKKETAVISVIEGPEQYVVLATEQAGTALRDELDTRSFVTVDSVPVGGGFHAAIMDDIVKNMKMYLEKVDFKDSAVPFVGGVIGLPLTTGDTIRAALMQHIHGQTQWHKVLETFADFDYILEVGPGKSIRDALVALYPDKKIHSIATLTDIENLKKELFPSQPELVVEDVRTGE